ncbi:nicotinamide mononucleotide transport protein [Escherichia coli]|nr:nicotinamide mononucleotide transport protein [Escherichia coli]
MFGIIFFQIQLYASLLLQVFFFAANILRLVCVVATNQSERGGVENSLVAIAEGTQLVGGLRCFDWSDDGIYQSGVCIFDPRGSHDHASIRIQVVMPELQPDAFPFWDSCMMVLSIVAMILMTRKYVENWLLWVIINVISVVIFALQGVYAMVSGVHHPDLYCAQRQPDVDQQRT